MTITLVVLAVVLVWFLVAAVTAYFCSAVVRGGHAEDEIRGYVERGPVAGTPDTPGDVQVPSPRRTEDGMAES